VLLSIPIREHVLSHDRFDSEVRQFWSSLSITNGDPGGRLPVPEILSQTLCSHHF